MERAGSNPRLQKLAEEVQLQGGLLARQLYGQVGERQDEAIMRRLEHGPDVQDIPQAALAAAFFAAGTSYSVDGGAIYLEY